ncbi:hypothetical protein CDD83_10891 [Cordyceps sp. RAO-2017]|nr:hypothetical protein CDD83_10891 [Cordyceps sp. RAO-2017]
MSFRPRPYDLDEDRDDAGDDATLRALDGAFAGVDGLQHAGAGDRQHGPSADDTGDVFLKIAREEPLRGAKDETSPESSQISAYRGHRSLHRRPLSTAVVGYHTTSPPQPCRRLSDHRDRPRFEHRDDDQATEISHTTAYRLLAREKAASVHPAEDTMYTGRPRAGSAGLRPSALAPRSPQVVFQDPMPDASAYARRRSSITDGNGSSPSAAGRLSAYKTSATGSAYGKAYNSSPLVRTFDSPNRPSPEHAHGGEGAESTMSTTAPSTVWDELDDLKSRIHRLELTGKLPSSSGTAASRLSDERPATATTTVTTASLSPKRQAGRSTEAASNASSQKEAHSILHAALAKSKPFISPDVYRALESAALDAMGLSTMMGTPGQPGPISSGASTIGSGSSITDRQLRRKADGVCRSLTELCVALGEDVAAQPRPAQPAAAQLDGPATPTIPKSYSGLPPPRKSSLAPENGLPKSNSSPRALSRFEERRNSLLNGTALPSPRAGAPSAPAANEANASRRSSLMVSRTRRTGIEEPDDGRNTSLLRSRRAGTEEPDEGRKTSFLVRNRRGTVGEESDESRFRAPSRANTDVNMLRGQAPEPQTTPPDSGGRTATGLSRRRFVSTSLHSSRLAAPTGSGVTPPRRYLERSAADHEAASARPAEEHGPRPPPLSQGISHLRANSLIVQRQNRDSMTSNTSPAAVASTFR